MNDAAQLSERSPIPEPGPIRGGEPPSVPISVPAIVVGVCAVVVLVMRRTVAVWAGDAVIHLRIAELMAQGRPFEFNAGESVGASTSLLWTFLLAGLFRVLDPAAVAWVVKAVCIVAWCGTALVMAVCWARIYGSRAAGLLAASAYALNPSVFRNAVTGMEASAFALQLVLLFAAVFAAPPAARRVALAFSLSALATLTRPEGVIFTTVLAGYLAARDRGPSRLTLGVIAGAAIGVVVSILANLHATGSPIPDSAAARLATGLRDSVRIGSIHADPSSLLLLVGYLPLSLGLAVSRVGRIAPAAMHGVRRTVAPPWRAPATFTLLLTAAMLAFYTFIAGAAHTSRYWLPFLPFVFGVGSGTLVLLHHRLRAAGMRRVAGVGAAACVAWLAAFHLADGLRRRGAPIGHPHGAVAAAVSERPRFTARFLRELGVTDADPRPISIAVTEVQLRYFLADDGTVRILSLDGRTDADFGRYVDPETGLRRFDRYLREERPDFVELGQFDPAEPVLPAVLAAWERGERAMNVDGFRFVRTDRPYVVRYLHDR